MKITKMHSLLLAGVGTFTVPFVTNNHECSLSKVNNAFVAPKDGTIVVNNYTKLFEYSNLDKKSTTYLKNKSAISLMSKIK